MLVKQSLIKFQYLLAIRKNKTICDLFDIPILILLWWLDYKIAFVIVLGLIICSGWKYAKEVIKREKELDLDI